MGTRADFYIGRGENAEWIGSIAWDGYPGGIDNAVLDAKTQAGYIDALMEFFGGRDDVSGPDHGWPWPWHTSGLTDFSYAFDDGKVWVVNFGYAPWRTLDQLHSGDCECDECEFNCRCAGPDDRKYQCEHKVRFPDMENRQRVTFGNRSGVMVFGTDG